MESSDRINEFTFEEMCTIVSSIATRYDLQRVYLFGSRARGDNNPDSDFDFCVLPGKTCSILHLSGFLCDLKEVFGTNVDIVSERGIDENFMQHIHSDRRLVYEA